MTKAGTVPEVLPRYYIGARKRFDFGQYMHLADDSDPTLSQWEDFVMDREKSHEVYGVMSSPAKAELERARRELEGWLERKFPQHRDLFAYWSDCVGRQA
ncbi:hypothetical protein [Paraburkholderia sacchari]|uniref:hypothetical protein n=1 Tax=Paraburkholderia sacchari TaxID=159450 RepID=UPI0039A518AD